ncbi:MAG: RluA family pseudouridine synthase [Pseudomonadota bacterium]
MSEQKNPAIERTPVQTVTVAADDSGQRLDNYVMAQLRGLPRSRVYRLVRKGEVRVNGRRAAAKQRLEAGDRVRLPPVTLDKETTPLAGARPLADLSERIVFEDKTIVVVDKPSGLAVHGGSGIQLGLIETLRQLRPDLAEASLVHRLDRATSGIVVVAKRRSALRRLHAAFRAGDVSKRYLAGCIGHWSHGSVAADKPLEVRHRRNGERHVIVSEAGKASLTRFSPEAFYDGLTVLSAEPVSGRTHQIRVHAAALEHPLAGDARYGDSAANMALAKHGLKRLFLHAQSIAFADTSGNEQLYNCPLASDLDKVLVRLKRQQ